MVELQTQAATRKNMQYKHHLLEIPQFTALFPTPARSFLRDDTLSPLWIGRCRRKSKLVRWEISALQITDQKTVRSVTAKPLSFWLGLDVMDIRAHIIPIQICQKTILMPAGNFLSVKRVIGRHLEASCLAGFPHLPQVVWCDDIPICLSCSS